MAYVPDIAVEFVPGVVGGVEDWALQINKNVSGSSDPGEIWLSGTYYKHPDGTTYTIASVNSSGTTELTIRTTFGDTPATTRAGVAYLMWSSTAITTRFETWSWAGVTDNLPTTICAVRFLNGVWEALDNNNVAHSFTPVAGDVLLASFEGGPPSQGIQSFYKFTENDSGITNDEATQEVENNLICDMTGFKVPVKPGLKKQWNNLMVREKSWERRHPLELARVKAEKPGPAPHPEQPDRYIEDLYPNGVSLSDLDP